MSTIACGPRGTPPLWHSPTPTKHSAPDVPSLASSDYVPSDYALAEGRKYLGGQGRALLDGYRVAPNEPECMQTVEPPLLGGILLPTRFGSGFLFWNSAQLFHASTFTGSLTSVLKLPAGDEISRTSVPSLGVSSLLIHREKKPSLVWSPNQLEQPPLPAEGVRNIAVEEDGRGAMLDAKGDLWLRGAHQASFQRSPFFEMADQALYLIGGRAIVIARQGRYVVDDGGNLCPISAKLERILQGKAEVADARWRLDRSPRERAFEAGVPLSGDWALAEAGGVLAKVELRTGQLAAFAGPFYPGLGQCHLFSVRSEVLALCRHADHRILVFSGLEKMAPRLERSFGEERRAYLGGGGHLAITAPCLGEGQPETIALCVRESSGEWKEYSTLSTVLPRGEVGDPPSIARWVPREDGSVRGLVFGWRPGFIDLPEGRFTEFCDGFSNIEPTPFAFHGETVGDSFTILGNGRMQGYTSRGILQVDENGEILEKTWGELNAVANSGANGFGCDSQKKCWQSNDYGSHWREVEPPPALAWEGWDCSAVGCRSKSWYRIGYPRRSPTMPRPPRPSAMHPLPGRMALLAGEER